MQKAGRYQPIRRLFTAMTARSARRFAPLNPEKGKDSDAPVLKGIVFDVDGTLWYACYLNMFQDSNLLENTVYNF